MLNVAVHKLDAGIEVAAKLSKCQDIGEKVQALELAVQQHPCKSQPRELASDIMSASRTGWRCLRCSVQGDSSAIFGRNQVRQLSFSASCREQVETPQSTSSEAPLDPNLVYTPRLERRLVKETGKYPVGSRRRRAALRNGSQIPFEQLPYQCFQEARSILAEDRAEKLEQIDTMRARIRRVQEQEVDAQNARSKERKLISMEQHLEELKILADINDPLVKRNFEDGIGERFPVDRQV